MMMQLLVTTLLSLFSIQALACSGQEMSKRSEVTIKNELGAKFLKIVKVDSPARATQSNTYLASAVALDKNNNKHVMYFRYEMNTSNLKCDLLEKTEASAVDYEGGCDRSEMVKVFKMILKSDDVISEVRDFKAYEPKRIVNGDNMIMMAASSVDDYQDLRLVYMSLHDKGDSCKVIDYTNPAYN